MPVCASAYLIAALFPNSRAVAAIADTQGEQVMINTMNASAAAGVIAAERSVP